MQEKRGRPGSLPQYLRCWQPRGLSDLLAHVNDVRVGPCPGVVSQIEARMVRIFVDYDRIRIPEPIRDVGKVLGSNAKVGASEPESVRATAFEAEDMTGSESQCKASMLPRTIHVIASIVTTHIVTNPLAVIMHVRGLWMSLEIAEIALVASPLFSSPLFSAPLFRLALFGGALLHGSLPLLRSPLLGSSLPGRWRRTVGWDISAANPAVLAAPAPISILRHAWYCKAHREQR